MARYATAVETRAWLQMTTATYDTQIEGLLDAVSEAIDRQTNHPDGFVADAVASARTFAGKGLRYLYIPECAEITLIAVKDSVTDDDYDSWLPGDWFGFRGDFRRPTRYQTPYTAIMVDPTGDESIFTDGMYGHTRAPTVQVTARWGYATTCPPTINTATAMLAARWYKRLQTAMAASVGVTKSGVLNYNIAAQDPDIWGMLKAARYVRAMIRFGGHSG